MNYPLRICVVIMTLIILLPIFAEGTSESIPEYHFAGPLADLVYDPALDNMGSSEILTRSRLSPSLDERGRLRGYLALKRPDTIAGIIARAWIASAEGDSDQAVELYLRALERDPNNLLALNNLGVNYNTLKQYEKKLETGEKILSIDPSYDYRFVWWTYWRYLNDLQSPERAAEFLSRMKTQLGADHYSIDYVAAELAEENGDFQRAISILETTIEEWNNENDPIPYWLREALALLQYNELQKADTQDVANSIKPLFDLINTSQFYYQPQDIYRANMLVAEKIYNDIGTYISDLSFIKAAFRAYPAAEPIEKFFNILRSRVKTATFQFLNEVRTTLPYSSLAATVVSWNYRQYDFDPQRAENAARAAITLAATPEQRRNAVIDLTRVLLDTQQDYDAAYQILITEDAYNSQEAERQRLLYTNRFEAQDYSQSLDHLNKRYDLGNINETWYTSRHNELQQILSALANKQSTIQVAGSFDSTGIAVSSDATLAALGFSPMQLWDIPGKTKLYDLGRGGFDRAFSPDGKYIATTTSYRTESGYREKGLYVYRVSDGHLMFVVGSSSDIGSGMAWKPDSSQILFIDSNGSIRMYSVPDGKPAGVFRAWDQRITGRVTWLPQGIIALALAQDDFIRLVDDESLQLLKLLDGVSWPHTVTHTRDGKHLVATDNKRRLHVWNTQTWEKRSKDIPMFVRSISVHGTKPLVSVTSAADSDNIKAVVYDIETMGEISRIESGSRSYPAFAGDTLLIGDSSYRSYVSVRNPHSLEEIDRITSISPQAYHMRFLAEHNVALVRDNTGTHVFDIDSGQYVNSQEGIGALRQFTQKRFVHFEDNAGQVYSFTNNQLIPEEQFEVGVRNLRFTLGNNIFATAGIPFHYSENERKWAEKAQVELYDSETYRKLSTFEIPFATEFVTLDVYEAYVHSLDISKNEDAIAILTSWQDGFGTGDRKTQTARIYNPEGELISRIEYNGNDIYGVEFSDKNNDEIILRFGSYRRRYNWKSGKYIAFEGYYDGNLLPLSDGNAITWTSRYIEHGEKSIIRPDFIRNVAVDEAQNLLMVYTRQNHLHLYDLKTFDLLTTTVRFATADTTAQSPWISYTPEGYFVGSSTLSDKLAYVVAENLDFYDINRFVNIFEAPDIIRAKIAGRDINDFTKGLTLKTAVESPPPHVSIKIQDSNGIFGSIRNTDSLQFKERTDSSVSYYEDTDGRTYQVNNGK